jgi:hypothetical protein
MAACYELEMRRVTGILGGLALLIIGGAPYALVRAGRMTHDTFNVFVALDIIVLVVLLRALFTPTAPQLPHLDELEPEADDLS